MRTIETTRQFRRDFKREKKGLHGKKLDARLTRLLQLLSTDQTLSAHFRDHALTGEWSDHRDCHVRKPDDATLQLIRLGSHSELGW